jgi:hypothetical protein
MQQQAMSMMMNYNASMMSMKGMMMGQMMSGNGMMMGNMAMQQQQQEGPSGRGKKVPRQMGMGPMSMMPMSMSMDCVGDGNCPGTMKCCSHDMSVYYPSGMSQQGNMMQGMYGMMRNMNPTHGYCMEPVMMASGGGARAAAKGNKMQ